MLHELDSLKGLHGLCQSGRDPGLVIKKGIPLTPGLVDLLLAMEKGSLEVVAIGGHLGKVLLQLGDL